MLGRENGSDARTREEIMYWKSLNPFFKVDLHANFRHGIEIPLYFSENVKRKLPHKVAVKGPSVNFDTWEVQLKTINDTTWVVGEDWEDFAAAFALEENDTLVFKYKNNSYFKVRIFNGKTSCERESSRFVVKSVSQKTCSLNQETISDAKKVTTNNDQSSVSRYSREKYVLSEEPDSDVSLKRIAKRKDVSSPASICDKDAEEPKPSKVKTDPEVKYIPLPCNSYIREHREMQIHKARQRACELQGFRGKSFYVALSSSHVSGTMRLEIPKKWWNEIVNSKNDTCLKLRANGNKEYDSRPYVCSYDKSNCTATITTGWSKFVRENFLHEHDCCVFSLADKPLYDNFEYIHLEVEIIHSIIP